MKEFLHRAIRQALSSVLGLELEQLPAYNVEPPREVSHGDLASNVALVLARQLRRRPRDIAVELANTLEKLDDVDRVEVAGPGFLNFFITPAAWQRRVVEILQKGDNYGRRTAAGEGKVLLEFVSANPTGPLHFGHGRGAVVGDVLAALLEFAGWRVTREYYVNDAGAQVDALVESIIFHLRRERGLEAEFPADGYRGDYVRQLAQELPDVLTSFLPEDADAATRKKIRAFALQRMMDTIRDDLSAFGISIDRFAPESQVVKAGRVNEVIERLDRHGHLERREGALWFLADRFGDSKPRVLVKSNGQHTYFATDIAYHLDKTERGYQHLIDVWGADHHGYVPRMKAALQALQVDPRRLEVILVQMVSLLRNGQPVVMSKRQGQITTLRGVVDEVGRDAARFFFLLRGPDSQMGFDLELAKRRSLDNPVYYVQYGHARLCSILERAAERGLTVPRPEQVQAAALLPLELPEELEIIKKMTAFPELVLRAAESRAPHLLVFYLQELVAIFHRYYTSYSRTSPILGGDPPLLRARLFLVLALRQVLRNALALLGVAAPEHMDTPPEE